MAGSPELPADVRRQARGLLRQAWLGESEQLAWQRALHPANVVTRLRRVLGRVYGE